MKLMRYIGTVSIAGALSMAMAGYAFADDAAIDTTGPNSTQTVKIDNSSSIDTTNNNDVQVANINEQQANTGDVLANKNTTVSGGLGSGEATNDSTTSTSITIGNQTPATPGNGNGSGSGAVGSGSGAGTPGSGGGTGAAPGRGGAVLGASTPGLGAGEAILPVTGPSEPVDVSALRAAWHPSSTAAKQLVKQTQMFSTAMLALAALLALVGAVASAVFARRQEGRS